MVEGGLHIRVLGELAIRRDGHALALPPSKKTRALLVFLLLTRRAHRRERLCGMFWDVADDPRGALRWSLSRLRPLLDEPGVSRLQASREGVEIVRAGARVDLLAVRESLAGGVERASTEALVQAAEELRGELLEGLELPDFHDFQAWCLAEREEARALRSRVLRALVQRLTDSPAEALPHARALCQVEAYDEAAAARLVEVLGALGRRAEAEEHYGAAVRRLQELGVAPKGELEAAWRRAKTAVSAPAEVRSPIVEAPHAASAQALPLVGRDRELGQLRRALQRDDGTLRAILLTGEPGAGKTRLLAELASAAQQRGGAALSGASFEVERGRAYGPWIDALRSLPDAAALFDERGEHDERTRDRLFMRVAELVGTRAAEAAPLLLAFDDVQWLDATSAMLLHFVARTCRERPVLVALAARAGELQDNARVLELVRGLRRDGSLDELRVGPLDEGAVRALAGAIDPSVSPERVLELSAGNALYAIELARAGGDAGPSSSLSDLVRDRLTKLPPDAREVLDWASILGRSFRAEILERLGDVRLEERMSALATLERHAFLIEVADPASEYAFAHDVVRQVVHGDLSSPRRRLMHRRVAAVLAEQAHDDTARAAEVAHHAALGGDDRLAVRELVRAARRCVRLFANDEAEALVRRGMRLVDQLAEPERTERAVELADLHHRVRGSMVDTDARGLEELAHRAIDQGSVEHAQLGFQLLSHAHWDRGEWKAAQESALQGEAVGRAGDLAVRARSLAHAARCLALLERDLPRAEALAREAAAVVRELGAEPFAVPLTFGMLRLHEGALDEAQASIERARELARREQDRLGELYALEQMAVLALARGALDDAQASARELVAIAAKVRAGSELPLGRAIEALCACWRDEGAWSALDEAIEQLGVADSKQRLAFVLTRAASVAMQRADSDRAEAYAARAVTNAEGAGKASEIALARVMRARVAIARGDPATAEDERRILAAMETAALSMEARDAVRSVLEDA